MANQVSQIVPWVGLVVLLQIRDGEGHVQVPDVLDGDYFVELLFWKSKAERATMHFTKIKTNPFFQASLLRLIVLKKKLKNNMIPFIFLLNINELFIHNWLP